jgi:hypothetical protein
VHAADVYVLICGFRYGTPVRDQPNGVAHRIRVRGGRRSGIAATGVPVGEDTQGPPAMFRDPQHGTRQEAFRARLLQADRIATTVTTPDRPSATERSKEAIIRSMADGAFQSTGRGGNRWAGRNAPSFAPYAIDSFDHRTEPHEIHSQVGLIRLRYVVTSPERPE